MSFVFVSAFDAAMVQRGDVSRDREERPQPVVQPLSRVNKEKAR